MKLCFSNAVRGALGRCAGAYGILLMWALILSMTAGLAADDVVGSQAVRVVEDLRLLPGFQAELLYTVPKPKQGSWISIATERHGRLIVSDQYGPLYRVAPGNSSTNTVVKRMDVPVGRAHGLLCAKESLFVVGEGPHGAGLYRLRDEDGDDQYEDLHMLKELEVGEEHGAHAVVLGPDDHLYVVAGNHAPVPEGIDPASPFGNYDDDWLLPQMGPPSGHASSIQPPAGFILKTDEDGRHWQMLCGGFRNPYDIAFNQHGELFAYDADMEYDTGCPWYRPTRVNHALSGADFGWRRGAAKWPAYYADSVGSVIDIGQGSPTGITFGYGARFPAKYQNALYLNDWTYGRIRAVYLQPHGASYTATAEDFVVGRPLPLTDSIIGTDGAMYFLVGGRRTQSKLFRLTYVGDEPTDPAPSADTPQAAAARHLRRKLEALHHHVGVQAVDEAWPHLDSPDRALRHAARIAVEHQPVGTWEKRAMAEHRSQALITAMVALARCGKPAQRSDALARLNSLDLDRLPAEQSVEALRAYALWFIRAGRPTDEESAEVGARLESCLPSDDSAVNQELVRLLVYLKSDRVASQAVALLKRSRLQEEQMFYTYVLRHVRQGWSMDDRRTYFRWLNRARFQFRGGAPFANSYFRYEGGRSFRPYNAATFEEAVATLSGAESKDPELMAIIEATAPPPPENDLVLQLKRQPNVWSVSDLAPLLSGVRSGRSFKVGKAAFDAVGCARCHKLGTFAGNVSLGPDLDTAGSRYSPQDLLESIIEPSKVISDQLADRYILTKSGVQYRGAIVEENQETVVIKPDPAKPAVVTIPVSEIDRRGISKISRMPTGLLDPLTADQILDLLAYVLSGANPSDPAFARSTIESR